MNFSCANRSAFIKGPAYTSKKTGLARFMGEGLVTSNGDFWKRQRRLVAPAFHAVRVHAYADTMVDYTLQRLEGWRDGAALDVDEEMMQLTLTIVAPDAFRRRCLEHCRPGQARGRRSAASQ